MADSTASDHARPSWAQRLKQYSVPAIILFMAAGILLMISGNWNTWASERAAQETDDAYLRADLTPLSTKVAGLVATVAVSDYQPVKSGDLLVQLRDDDFRAQVQQAEAAVMSGEDALINNQRQKELQDARTVQAEEGIHAGEADIAAADAGIEAARSAIVNARSGMDGTRADVDRTLLERRRQEALVATESATRQKVEQVVADEQRFRAQLASREADISTAAAQLASRQADLARARAPREHESGVGGAEAPARCAGFTGASASCGFEFEESFAFARED
jgi:membrane fusion protein (multidrug efflux system)